MKKIIFTILFSSLVSIGFGQSSETRYFKNEWLGKEVSMEKAKYSQTTIQNDDGTTTTEVKDLSNNEIIRNETFKGNEPYGIWKFRYGGGFKTIDYNFPLVYSDEKCNDITPLKINDYFQDNDSLGYKAPVIKSGELNFNQYLAKNIIYPMKAKDEGIQGVVYLMFTLTKSGTIENLVVMRGKNILLDKEAVRVIKQLQFDSPPTINGQPVSFNCLALPIRYALR